MPEKRNDFTLNYLTAETIFILNYIYENNFIY